MKIAGTKNVGAWSRMNKFLKKELTDTEAHFVEVIGRIESLPAYLAACNDIASKAGVIPPSALGSAGLFAQSLVKGIPLQVWMGKFTFDTYSEATTDGGKTVYRPDHTAAAREFGGDLRKALTLFKFALAELRDVENIRVKTEGNPGGIADSTPDN